MLKLLAAINESKVKKCTTILKEGSCERVGYMNGLERRGRRVGYMNGLERRGRRVGYMNGLERRGRRVGCANRREAVVSASQNIFREISLSETLLDYSR